jgi:hypothetical protein
MLPGEVGADDLGTYISRGKVHRYSLPTIFPMRISEEAIQHFGVEIALAFEIRVEATVS